jgi:hypothetical protein
MKVTLPLTISSKTRLLNLGKINYEKKAFHTPRYIYPVGYKSEKKYLSFVTLEGEATYTCEIAEGADGPIFRVTTNDSTDVFESNNPTGCCLAAMVKVNDLHKKRKNVSVSGPEFFQLAQKQIKSLIECLPGAELCAVYEMADRKRNVIIKHSDGNEEQEDEPMENGASETVATEEKVEEEEKPKKAPKKTPKKTPKKAAKRKAKEEKEEEEEEEKEEKDEEEEASQEKETKTPARKRRRISRNSLTPTKEDAPKEEEPVVEEKEEKVSKRKTKKSSKKDDSEDDPPTPKTPRGPVTWSAEEDKAIKDGRANKVKWETITKQMNNKTIKQTQNRWYNVLQKEAQDEAKKEEEEKSEAAEE